MNKLYAEFNERKELMLALQAIMDECPEYELNDYVVDIIVSLVVDETKNIEQLTTKKRNELIGRSSYVWKYMVRQNGDGHSMTAAYHHIMSEREKGDM